jgi:hypothetical protein
MERYYRRIVVYANLPMSSHPAASTICLNCGAPTAANFCSSCGQETRLHVASAAEFFHEFIGHYIALEGKLWQTLWLLISRPGKLTADYIAGRRVRYVAPLRVYLSLSLLFFALLKFGPVDFKVNPGDQPPDSVVAAGTPAPTSNAVAEGAPPRKSGVHVSTKLGQFNPKWETRIREMEAMPLGQSQALLKAKFFAYVPYAVFLIMPVFALYLKLLYLRSGRSYGEHMLFALHTNAFAFLMLGLILLVQFHWVSWALFAWMLGYLPLAMRRVYGGSKRLTVLRWIVVMMAYVLTMVVAILAVMFITAIVL